MAHLLDWDWVVSRRKIDVADWFLREGIDTYEKAIEFAKSRGLTPPSRKQFEEASPRPRVAKKRSSNTSSRSSASRSVPKKRTRNTKKKAGTTGSIAAVEAIEKSKKVKTQDAPEDSEAAQYFRAKRKNAKK
tara:strand:+ start:525 stop:920 length:396 start_codon:yes stop_codon:yes gene_type:complete